MRPCEHRRACAAYREKRRFSLKKFDELLQRFYLKPMQDMLNNSTLLWKRLFTEPDPVSTKTFTIPLHVSNPGISPLLPAHYRPKSNG
jgi:hypothetical protein